MRRLSQQPEARRYVIRELERKGLLHGHPYSDAPLIDAILDIMQALIGVAHPTVTPSEDTMVEMFNRMVRVYPEGIRFYDETETDTGIHGSR